ncbi:MAG: FHA domain-containing protein, partial [Pseudomonadota bacterium]
GYKTCCHRAALDPAAAFCGECATPLIRCMNFNECLQLVEPMKPCPICLNPELIVEEGAVSSGGVGTRLAIPLKLRNHNAELPRPIFLKRLLKRESGQDETEVPLDWQVVEAGAERSFLVEAGPFDTDGVARVELLLTMAMRSKEGFEEAYVFGGSLLLTVARDSAQQVVQNIDFSGAHFETGGLVKTDLRVDDASPQQAQQAGRRVLPLERLEVSEVKEGIRGYGQTGVRVPRTVQFAFHGFPEKDAPNFEVRLGARGALAMGRSGRERDPERNPSPMDVSLRAYGASGALDLETSNRVSRHHFDLVVLNDRLCVHVRSAKGAIINDRQLAAGSVEPINDGDLITPSGDVAGRIGLRAHFRSNPHGVVERIDLRRDPS